MTPLGWILLIVGPIYYLFTWRVVFRFFQVDILSNNCDWGELWTLIFAAALVTSGYIFILPLHLIGRLALRLVNRISPQTMEPTQIANMLAYKTRAEKKQLKARRNA